MLINFGSLANATVMTFGSGLSLNPLGYTEGGLTISGVAGPTSPYIRDWPTTVSPNTLGGPESGEREFLFNHFDGSFEFSLVAGGAFDLLGFDVENPAGLTFWSSFGLFDVVGSNGAFAQISGSIFGAQALVGFRGLTWFTLSCGDCQATIDNISFVAISVPEPTTLALFAFGLAGLGFFMTRRTRVA